MSESRLYLSPNGEYETEIPFFVVYERPERDFEKVPGELKGSLKIENETKPYEFPLYYQGTGVVADSARFMGELSLHKAGNYVAQVAGETQEFQVVARADNLSFMREFGVFFIGTAILLVVVFCWAMIRKQKTPRGTQ